MSHIAVCCDPDGGITDVLMDDERVLGAEPEGKPVSASLVSSAVGMWFELMSVLARVGVTSEWLLEFETATGPKVYQCAAAREDDLLLIVGGRKSLEGEWRTLLPAGASAAVALAEKIDARAADPLARIADLKRQVLALQEQTKLPEKLENELIRVAAHDLRNPLLVMKMNSEFLLQRGKMLDSGMRTVLKDMLETCEYMDRFLDGMTSVSKVWLGELQLERTDVDLGRMMGTTVRRIADIAASRNIKVEITRVDATTLSADERLLSRVVHELFANTMKFCPSGTAVRARLVSANGRARIRVEDDGPGIPLATQKVLFRPFGKSPVDDPIGYGAGVGLPICRRIIEAHGGTLRVTSREGQGTRIDIELPGARLSDWGATDEHDGDDDLDVEVDPDATRRLTRPK